MEKKDWLQKADDYLNERERYLLDAIVEVERLQYSHPELFKLDEAREAVLCFLAGALSEIRRAEGRHQWLIQKRAKEEPDEEKT